MNVLSLFDGISCARVALEKAKIPVKTYYASEIDKHAIQISQKNYPDIVRLGDVRHITHIDEPIGLLIGGSPCQDLSIANKDRKGLEGNRSSLFWEYVRILNLVKPTYFILENVASMPKKDKDTITEALGVEPVLFNASLVSAQSRKRLFWTNIKFDLPEDRGILLKDILQPDAEVDESIVVGLGTNTGINGSAIRGRQNEEGKWIQTLDVRKDEKANAVVGFPSKTCLVKKEAVIRKLTPIECERLQGLPDDYTNPVSKTHRYKCLGNAFHTEVIAHILSAIHK